MMLGTTKASVPPRALVISLLALVVPVVVVLWLPDWTSNGLGMLIWLTALIPAFLLAYYRGLRGVAIALAGGMAVITATQLSVVTLDMADPNWRLLIGIVVVYLLVSGGIAVLAEVLQRERREAEELAHVDRLTNLPNRRHADIILAAEFAAAERGGRFSVVMFDLDHFKRVNDRHGHPAGDMTLTMFGKILRDNTRRENLSARYGGEEFVSVLRNARMEDAVFYAQRVVDQIRAIDLPWGKQTVSAGVAEYERGMGSFEILLGAADRALYQAKEGGRDMVCSAPRQGERRSSTARRISTEISSVAPAAPGDAPAGRIWLADDDSSVRSVVRRLLVHGGYEVWDTGNPLEMIERFKTVPASARPDLIVTDVIMPQMTGVRMVDEIVTIVPEVRVVYMSGYVQSDISWNGTEGAVVAFIDKPITSEKLLAAIAGVLRDKGAAGGVNAATAPGRPIP